MGYTNLTIKPMPNFASQIKTEISRLAKKESRQETAVLKKASAHHRSDIAALKRRVAQLESVIGKLTKVSKRLTKTVEPVADDEKLRWRVPGFVSLRKNLGLSAEQMGKLVGVTGQSIYKWEQGKSRPRPEQLKAIAAVRKMGKRQVMEMLGDSAGD